MWRSIGVSLVLTFSFVFPLYYPGVRKARVVKFVGATTGGCVSSSQPVSVCVPFAQKASPANESALQCKHDRRADDGRGLAPPSVRNGIRGTSVALTLRLLTVRLPYPSLF